MIEQFAIFYVHFFLPAARAALVFLVILTVLWVLIVINDAKKGKELISNVFNVLWTALSTTIKWIALGIWAAIKFILRFCKMIIESIRDFFFSSA